MKINYKPLSNRRGFTIIEVLIVLAIAGLILLLVFLAVPALQRNSRNTQRKTDVANIGGAINEYIANNRGDIPADDTVFDDQVFTNAKTTVYKDPAKIIFTKDGTKTTIDPDAEADILIVNGGMKCADARSGDTTGTSDRNIAVLYVVEGGAGNTPQCQEV